MRILTFCFLSTLLILSSNPIHATFVRNSVVTVQQKNTITGKVSDEKGNAIAGASVFVKGTSAGVISGIDGTFSLELPEGTTSFTVSFLGMGAADVVLNGQRNFIVTLYPLPGHLNEIMVVAYGTTTRESFAGSAGTVNQKQISAIQNPDVAESLQGNISGVEISQSSGSPRSSASIRIRGVGSINASSSPLIVVDGMPYGNSLNTLNSQDIETISVLKDAAATALYGSRAANGAILITTKKGKANRQNVEFAAKWGVSSRAVYGYETVNTPQYMELMWEGLYNGYASRGMQNPDQLASKNLVGTLLYNPYSVAEPVGADGKISQNARLLWDSNWADAIYNTGKNQEYGLVLSGGDESNLYYLSLGYLDFDGILLNSAFKRYSARLNNQRKMTDWLTVGMNFSGSSTNSSEPVGETGSNSLNYQASAIAPVYPIYLHNNNGNIINDSAGNPLYDFGMNGDQDGRPARPYWANPGVNFLGSEKYDKNSVVNDQLSMRTFAEFQITKELSLKSNLYFDYAQTASHQFLNALYGAGSLTKGRSTKTEAKQKVWTVNNILNYRKTFEKHSVSVLAGHERYKLHSEVLSATKTNFNFENMDELAAGSVISAANSTEDNYALESFLSGLNYDFASRYYFSASYRTDGSSRFHKDVRWGSFWSVGTAWRISEEDFMKTTETWLTNLKIKASYGTVGNDNLGTYYAYQQLYATGHNNLDQTGVQISRLGTPELTWEVSKTSNMGVDLGVLQRINLEFEVFKRKVTDMLFARPLPLSAGVTSVDENIGDMQNTGFETTLFLNPVNKNGFVWNVGVNATHYKNKITKLMQNEIIVGKFQYKEGGSVYDFYLKEWAGVKSENGDPLYYVDPAGTENRKTINNWFSAPKHNVGTALPDLFGGINNELRYKQFEFQMLWNYKIGGGIYDNAYQLLMQSGAYSGLNIHRNVLDRWTPENKTSQIPAMNSFNYNGNITSSRFIMDASYIRLRNVNLSYNLPSKWCGKANLNSCKLTLSGQNLLTFSHSTGYDPEAGFTNENNFNYPQMKVFSLGVNVTL